MADWQKVNKTGYVDIAFVTEPLLMKRINRLLMGVRRKNSKRPTRS